MNKKLIKTVSLILCLLLSSISAVSCSEPEYAIISDGNISSEGLEYSLYENGTAAITGGKAPESGILVIPASVDGHKVVSVSDSAFEGRSDFFALIIEGAPKYVGTYSFSGCTSLTYADLGGTSVIAGACFSETVNLTECHGLESVTEVGNSAFSGCQSLVKADFSKKLKRIGHAAFEGCASLSYFVLPSAVKDFGSGVFFDCQSLAYADLSTLKSIPDNTFTKCRSLVYPIISKAQTIGDQAFRGCSSLQSVFLPKSLKTVGNDAFSACDLLVQTEYGGSLNAFSKIEFGTGNDEFRAIRPYTGQKAPETLIISAAPDKSAYKSNEFIPTDAAAATSGDFTYVVDAEGNAQITSFKGQASAVTIPSALDGHAVTSIGEYAFGENTSLVSVDLGNTLTSVYEAAFYGCEKLAEIKNGNKISAVGFQAFFGTPWLASVSDGEFTVQFDKVLLSYNGSKNYVIVPSGVKSVAGGTFTTNADLIFAYLPSSVRYMGSQAFAFCDSLKLIVAPSVAEIGSYALAYAVNLPSVELPSLLKCGENALCDCHKLRHADLGDLIEEISGAVFFNDQNLRTVCIGSSVKKLSAEIYNSCMMLINVYNGTREAFKEICVENGDNYLSDMILIPLAGR